MKNKYKFQEAFGYLVELNSGLIPARDINGDDVFLFESTDEELVEVRGLWD